MSWLRSSGRARTRGQKSLPDRSLWVSRAELAAAEKTSLPLNPTDYSLISQSLSHAISQFHLNSDLYIPFRFRAELWREWVSEVKCCCYSWFVTQKNKIIDHLIYFVEKKYHRKTIDFLQILKYHKTYLRIYFSKKICMKKLKKSAAFPALF